MPMAKPMPRCEFQDIKMAILNILYTNITDNALSWKCCYDFFWTQSNIWMTSHIALKIIAQNAN